jgi:sarcosine oxidase
MFDAIIVGLGIHGSSSLAQISKVSSNVLGIEQFDAGGHCLGSSHGKSRIIRRAYFEHPLYVPLLKRSFELWRELQLQVQKELLILTGGLLIGLPNSDIIQGALLSVNKYNLEHYILTSDEIKTRFPVFTPEKDEMGIFETEAGYLIPEICVEAYQSLAKTNGATLLFNAPMLRWTSMCIDNQNVVEVETTKGTYLTKKLVLSVGPWAGKVYGSKIRNIPLFVRRNVMHWFIPASADANKYFKEIPVYIWELSSNQVVFYGFPTDNDDDKKTVKVAIHKNKLKDTIALCDADTVDRTVTEHDIHEMRNIIATRIPSLNDVLSSSITCMYTCTSNDHL